MRDAYLIAGMVGIAVAIGSLLFFFGPESFHNDVLNAFSPGSTSVASNVQFTVLEQGPVAYSITDRSNYRVTSRDDLATLWSLIYGSGKGQDVPVIDFNRYEVLAVFDGSHASDGYQLSIQAVNDQNSVRTIVINHTIPSKNCRLGVKPTSPFELIQVPKTSFSLAHQDITSTSTCAY